MTKLLLTTVIWALMYHPVDIGPLLRISETSHKTIGEKAQAAIIQLRVDSACVSMLGGLSAGPDVEVKIAGKAKNRTIHYYYKGVEVNSFPQPVQVTFTFSGQCENSGPMGRSFVIPEFVHELRYVFCWERVGVASNSCQHISPSAAHEYNSVWKEGNMTESYDFTIPADGIELSAPLKIEIYSGDRQLNTLFLQLPTTQNLDGSKSRTDYSIPTGTTCRLSPVWRGA